MPQPYAVSQLVIDVVCGIAYPEAKVISREPDEVIGEFATWRPVGTERATEVTEPEAVPLPRHWPFIEKHPSVRLKPFNDVEVAPEVIKRFPPVTVTPPEDNNPCAEMPAVFEVDVPVPVKTKLPM